jgi:hypothetical protein
MKRGVNMAIAEIIGTIIGGIIAIGIVIFIPWFLYKTGKMREDDYSKIKDIQLYDGTCWVCDAGGANVSWRVTKLYCRKCNEFHTIPRAVDLAGGQSHPGYYPDGSGLIHAILFFTTYGFGNVIYAWWLRLKRRKWMEQYCK